MHQELAQAVIDGRLEEAKALAQEALEQGLDAYACITNGLTKGMQQVGRLHSSGEYLLRDLLKSADTMEAAINVFKPALNGIPNKEVIALVVLEAVDESLDEEGKIFIGTMLNGNDLADDGQDPPLLHWIT